MVTLSMACYKVAFTLLPIDQTSSNVEWISGSGSWKTVGANIQKWGRAPICHLDNYWHTNLQGGWEN